MMYYLDSDSNKILLPFRAFVQEITHFHFDAFVTYSTILNIREFGKLPLKVQDMVVTKYQEGAIEVELSELIALTNGDEALLGNERKFPDANSNLWLTGLLSIPYFNISHVKRCILSGL